MTMRRKTVKMEHDKSSAVERRRGKEDDERMGKHNTIKEIKSKKDM